jgi:hypothetical protein
VTDDTIYTNMSHKAFVVPDSIGRRLKRGAAKLAPLRCAQTDAAPYPLQASPSRRDQRDLKAKATAKAKAKATAKAKAKAKAKATATPKATETATFGWDTPKGHSTIGRSW